MKPCYTIVPNWVYAYRKPWRVTVVVGDPLRYVGYIAVYHFDPIHKKRVFFIRWHFNLFPKPIISKTDVLRLKVKRKFLKALQEVRNGKTG